METYAIGPELHALPSELPIPDLGLQPVNAYLLRGEQPMLVDTGMPVDRDAFEEALWSLVDPADLRWIAITHDDRDHTGSLARILDRAPGAKVVTNGISLTRLSEEFEIPRERVVTVNPGSRISIGDRTLSFHRPPTFDSPGTLALFDHEAGTLFSSDSFGTVIPETVQHFGDADVKEFFEGFDVLNRAIAPWTALVDAEKFLRTVRAVSSLSPARLLSAHGPTVEGRMVTSLMEAMARIPFLPAWLPGADIDLEAALDAHGAQAAQAGQAAVTA
ncbi:MBL fold metallo-hydrolase [Streptomyces sp. APSN-46.1]|uniref:MBL fold metallo-hydrolase n=1 Tax=Streptomyces sp. APSN-46.1 TaxID=2929049 RepID=UPI001FB26365|nr:MBL fold metallo-hydrolase [Streptomyces sp. APSN-46.1]MCJ1681496.1 MBL fold metallo-hydrolase [Streptomyces sp. APSN-46.1]